MEVSATSIAFVADATTGGGSAAMSTVSASTWPPDSITPTGRTLKEPSIVLLT